MYYHLSDADWQLPSVWLWPPNPRFNVLASLRTLEIQSLFTASPTSGSPDL